MPGLYAHMDITRKTLSSLSANAGAAAEFAQPGPSASALEAIARAHPAYAALGSLGPDIFFLLPDFKPPFGSGLWGAANTIKDLYEWWDENVLEPWENTLGPIAMNTVDQLGALTGGLLQQFGSLAARALQFLIAYTEVLIVRQFDVFGLLGSGVPQGYDEQTFFWSDMLHYRKTFEFGRRLYVKAQEEGNEAFMAFALGWMSHLATDVTGHAFTNEKCGGPYRLHWQRHKLVENHMDARILDSEHGGAPIYNMLSNSALHLWVAFNPDGTSRHDFFQPQPGPAYATGDTTPDILDRKAKWDVDSDLPPDLARFLAEALREVYNDSITGVASPVGASASHPTILEEYQPGSAGYADADAIGTTYWWLYKFLDWTTTDYYKLRRPEPPAVIQLPPFPSPPGAGAAPPGPGASDASTLEMLLAILAWLLYVAQVINWAIIILPSLVASLLTYPFREIIYQYLEIPLYNAWLALHWYLAHTGFVLPMQSEVNTALMTLGVAPVDAWATLDTALNDLSGGLITPPSAGSEPSGTSGTREPLEPLVDQVASLPLLAGFLPPSSCPTPDAPSAFLRPWAYPQTNLAGDRIEVEPSAVTLSPYVSLQDATVLVTSMPGDSQARRAFELAGSEADTLSAQQAHLPAGRTLGDPVDFTAYVVARLTRDTPRPIPNFNLDADRGYGYLCWDWLRREDVTAAPAAYRNPVDPAASGHQYRGPDSPGFGWCPTDVISGAAPPAHNPHIPVEVRIRYIDRERKFE